MAPIQSNPKLPSEHNVTSRKTYPPCHQSLTPPDSPTKRSAKPQATVKDLKHLFDDHSQPGLDMVQLNQLLVKVIRKGYSSAESPLTNEPSEPSQSCFSSNEQAEKVQTADGLDPESPICTTTDNFKSYEKWASKSQFKTGMLGRRACKYKIAESTETSNDLDDYVEYAIVVRERVGNFRKKNTSSASS
ncbi:hypothetical protein N7489_011707 [Penicillium chrysogenum]|uniref:uncharacterized protein n=1 Tax=Penicillium chrysogenum TaxID=5076 RepID=UPI0024DF0737|nr:uncharacterized protein N7489_011707 [Penicillium chrysogenum]KAJ5230999.1 hypothetical protein N7489_011707 [Penicillium chrysogenum]